MKKTLSLVLAAIMIIALAAEAPAATAVSDEYGTYTPLPDSVKGITIVYGDDSREGSIVADGILFLQKLINSRSGGKITLEVHLNSELGSSNVDLFESVCAGNIHMTIGTPGSSLLGGDTGILDVPSLFADWDKLWKCMQEGELHDELVKLAAKKGATALYMAPRGYRVLTSNTPVRTLEDVKGLKMRLPSNPVWISMWSKLGANIVSIPMSEVYVSLQQGVVTAQENIWEQLVNNNLLEVQKYLIFTNHVQDLFSVYINTDFYDSFNPEIRTFLDECFEVLYGWYNTNVDVYIENLQQQARAQAERYGCTFMNPDQKLLDDMAAATEDIVREVRSYSPTADRVATLALKAMGHNPDFGK